MNRRVLLIAVATGCSTTAGCLNLLPSRQDGTRGGGGEEPRTSPADGGNQNESSPRGRSPTSEEQVSEGDGGTGAESSPSTGKCPQSAISETNVQQTICNGKQTDAEMFLAADSDAVSVSSEIIKFTFRNGTGGAKPYIPCRWVVYKQSNQGWEAIRSLKGGTTQKSFVRGFESLTLYLSQEPPTEAGQCQYSLDDPSPGWYLFGVQGRWEDEKTLFLASFELTE